MPVRYLVTIALFLLPLAARPAFVPPAPYPVRSPDGMFWLGTDELWTGLGLDGVWHLKNNSDTEDVYVTQLVYWQKGFDRRKEPDPKLLVTARRIDSDSPPAAVSQVSPVFVTSNRPAMLIGLRIPASGCWEVTACYQRRTFALVVSVEP